MKKTEYHFNLNRETLVGKIYDIIENQIVSGHIKPGTRLSEAKVAREFNVSRAPAREALLRLEDFNLLRKSHTGREVLELSIEEWKAHWEIKNVLEAYASMQAVAHATERDFHKLKSIVDEMRIHQDPLNFRKLMRLNVEFHVNIIKCSNNKELIELLKLKAKQIRWTSINFKKRSYQSFNEHKKIYEAFIKRDGNKVRMLMEKHTMRGMNNALKAIKESRGNSS